ncbi:MAG: S9 family peptidase [Bacteroidales bacterium]|nr:S9 family peptidase [Bacteroidales bacterium]
MRTSILVISSLLAGMTIQSCKTSNTMEAPVAAKKPKELTIHGDKRIDDYYWLRERENPEVIAYLEAENAYRESMTKESAGFRDELFEEIVGRIKQDDETVPYKENGYYYYTRFEEEKEYPIYCRKKGSLDSEEEIMANVNEMAEGHEYYHVAGMSVSPDNRYLAMGIDTVSRGKYTLYIKDLETGEMLEDEIPLTTGGASWASDNKTLFYTQKDDVTLRSQAIYRHVMGTVAKDDVLVFEETDETYSTYVFKSKSKKYMIIGSSSTLSNEYRYLPADQPEGEFKVIQSRIRGLEYNVAHYGDHFYIITNLDATNFRLMKTPVDRTEKQNWTEVIGHREDVFLEAIEIFKDYLVVEERKEGLNQLRVIRWDNGHEYYIDMGEEVYTAWISVNIDFDSELLRFGYSSLTTPESTYDYHLGDRDSILLKQQEVVGGDFDPANYETRRLHAVADDGKKIPMSIVYRKGVELDGTNPTLLYGYGSYGNTMDPYFNSSRLSLLDRGFVFAIAHIRGSQINGRPWYEDGKLLKKINTFTDFNDCAEHMIKEQYTSPDKLFAMGGSAGGLLMGAVINLQPELYKGVVAAVPFVDVVTTMLDDDIPLTTSEYDEWGNPNEEEYYRYMLSYSPYDQVEAGKYPNMLVTTGLHDSQVQYWEPAKWVAKLRDMKTDNNLLVLYCNMDTGHGGASGRFERYKETAMEYAFLLSLAGIKE